MTEDVRAAFDDIHDALLLALDILEFDGYQNDDVHVLLSLALRTARDAGEDTAA